MTVTHENTLLTGCPVKRVHIKRGDGFLFDIKAIYLLKIYYKKLKKLKEALNLHLKVNLPLKITFLMI